MTFTGTADTVGLPGTARFRYGTTPSLDKTAAAPLTAIAASQSPSAAVTGLLPRTRYYYELIVMTPDGTPAGTPATLTTPALPRLILGALTAKPSRFRLGKATGTTISFTLSRAATVTLTFQRRTAGSERGGRCVSRQKRGGHLQAKRCTRLVAAGRLGVTGHAGPNHVRFSGRLGSGRSLTAGSYLVTASAISPDGSRAAPLSTGLTASAGAGRR